MSPTRRHILKAAAGIALAAPLGSRVIMQPATDLAVTTVERGFLGFMRHDLATDAERNIFTDMQFETLADGRTQFGIRTDPDAPYAPLPIDVSLADALDMIEASCSRSHP